MNIGKILLSKRSVSGHNSSNISKKRKKKKKKMELEKRKSSREDMVQKLYDTCKQIFANGKAGYVPPPHDIQRLKSLLGMYLYQILIVRGRNQNFHFEIIIHEKFKDFNTAYLSLILLTFYRRQNLSLQKYIYI